MTLGDGESNGVKRWTILMQAVVSTVIVLGIVFAALTRGGYIMTRDAHAQDIQQARQDHNRDIARVDSVAQAAQSYREETRVLIRFLACIQSNGEEPCRAAYRGVIDLDRLLEPR